MGYSTEFTGELKFKKELSIPELTKIKTFLGEDCRDHAEWGAEGLTYIDLELTKDFSGLKWDGSEKTYDLTDKVNLIITQMQTEFPEFGLTGQLIAQGEDIEDRWVLSINENGKAVAKNVEVVGEQVKCPHCGESFKLEIDK